MFDLYGTDVQLLCICKKCHSFWRFVNDDWEKVNSIPIDSKFLEPIIHSDMKRPVCCDE